MSQQGILELNGEGGTQWRHLTQLTQRRLEQVVILRNDHMTIAHCAIFVMQLPCTQGMLLINNVYTLRGYQVWRPSSVLLTRIGRSIL